MSQANGEAASGSIMTKTYERAYELMEKLASSYQQMVYDRNARRRMLEVLRMDAFNALSTQLIILSKKIQSLEVQSQTSALIG